MPTRAQLERLADQAARDADELEARATAARAQEKALRALAAQVDKRPALRGVQQPRSINGSKMQLQTAGTTKSLRIAAGRTKREHPAKRRFLEAGKTDTDIALEAAKVLGVKKIGRSTVSAWMAKGSGFRPPPRKLAEHFEKKYGLPLDTWPRLGD